MANQRKSSTSIVKKATSEPRSLALSESIDTGKELCRVLTAVIHDTISGTVTSSIANAVCNAAGKILKAVELQQKYGSQQSDGTKILKLIGE
jgi:hypothetical protein